ncbi:major facilitator superfamily MFS_1 [Paraglaciecola sp. T6c]|uniref:MFS transporter n=1 Tax=Pseudoalteromonas atlantica (strain T6c / ATCC BAA-1087) TaxID=3042615 RepID=UPI00005C6060|nr:MFS transporter [Paraglaciecola sp. T6c]ABG38927.1 major facilitator superfamily MFS_1 [Paraglaciecola sp. T6c]
MSLVDKDSRYYLAGFLNACIMASLMPVLSLYAYRYLDTTATQLSTLLGGYALSSIMYAFLIARIVEQVGKHKHWLLGISFLAAGALVVLANTQNYLVVCVVMLGVFAPFHASTALLMGLAFRYFRKTQIKRVNARVMATVSAAWVVCPSMAFYTVEEFGFSVFLYALALVMPLLTLMFCTLPASNEKTIQSDAEIHQPRGQLGVIKNKGLLAPKTKVKNRLGLYLRLLPPVLFFALLSFAINLYQHILPVYFVEQALPVSLVGTLFMCAAIAEIVLIVRCVNLLSRFTYFQLFIIASVSGIAFFLLLPLNQSMTYLFLIQVLKALMYGLMAGLGVNLLQHLLPNEPTFGATLYQNAFAVGMLFAGFAAGGTIELMPPNWLFSISAMVTLLCLLILLATKRAFSITRLPHVENTKG